MIKLGDLVYMEVAEIAAHDIGCKFRSYPAGKVWWERAKFTDRDWNILVSRLEQTASKPLDINGRFAIRQRNSYYGQGCVMEVQVNEDWLLIYEDNPDMKFERK